MVDITATLWFLGALSLALAPAPATADVYTFNDELDGFFTQFRADIQLAHNFQFPLPDFHAVYTKSILFLDVHGELNGTAGSVRDIGTIRRTNNVTISTAREYFVLRAEFGFDELTVDYLYKAKFIGIPFKGNLEVNINNNSIYLELLVNLTDDRCSGNVLTVRNLRFTALDHISVRVTGFSLANRLVGYWFSRLFTGVVGPIQQALQHFFKDNLAQFDLCQWGRVPQNLPFDDTDSSADLVMSLPDDLVVSLPDGITASLLD